ncbi:UPF0481 protein At3g47200-like [Cornus florida]|uniref:UPF0481 protein At3g47200-like n=1 Tax=Cornus florida TaxID=4283 RepID=UPI00289F922E|nr:UPF0481 protein At3g47200-like [Cornus florida]
MSDTASSSTSSSVTSPATLVAMSDTVSSSANSNATSPATSVVNPVSIFIMGENPSSPNCFLYANIESAKTLEEHVSISIVEKLARHSDLPPERCIFKVHEKLRKINPDAYEPAIVAIGPYHRGKTNLQGMEKIKLHYLKSLLVRRKETSAERYVIAMRALEEEARKCYAEPIGVSSEEFVHMMLLDGCFIVELVLKLSKNVTRDENDPIFRTDWMPYFLALDLFLFENQVPFFVLLKLYDLIEGPKEELVNIALSAFNPLFQDLLVSRFDMNSLHKVQHILDLLHSSRCPPFGRIGKITRSDWESIQCTSQLQKAGIKFKKAEGSSNLFDITYSNGTMRIPHLTIDDYTESLFRNLIAHEQYGGRSIVCYITHYCMFMDYLVDYAEDISSLRRDGIITNSLGGDEVVSTMFSKLGYNININPYHFSYANIFNDVNKHCRKRQHIWMATLRHDYFNSPWAIISFLGAVLLLLLTIIQAVFGVCSFFVHKS